MGRDYRLNYHLMPCKGWMNDPNGLCFYHGEYHIYYQACVDSAAGNGSAKGWGHFKTKDFIHYEDTGIANVPSEPFERDGAYSGSAVIKDDQMHFFYTGNVKEKGDYDYIHAGRQHNTIHAYSKNGDLIEDKHVIFYNRDYPAFCTCHVRDPKIIQHKGHYEMVLGVRTQNDEGCAMLYESSDLKEWKYLYQIKSEHLMGYMWECPDIYEDKGQRYLICCPQGLKKQGYDYENVYDNGYFHLEGDLAKDYRTLDHGFDFYAPQTMAKDGRTILIGWMGLPDTDYSNPTKSWQHALTLPRVLMAENGRLMQSVIPEIAERTVFAGSGRQSVHPKRMRYLFDAADVLDVSFNDIHITYADHLFTLDLSKCGQGRTQRHLVINALECMECYVDESSIEIFLNHGRETMTSRYYDGSDVLTAVSNVTYQEYEVPVFHIQKEYEI